MLDAVSLDQLRTFIAAVDEGSFSAAGRKISRAQSVVSQTIGNLENQIGVALFDRSGRLPRLTGEGAELLVDARAIIERMDGFKAKAKGMSSGLEPELPVVIDVMFPIELVTEVARKFAMAFPAIPFRLHIEALGAVAQQVLDGRCSLGITGSLPDTPIGLRTERLMGMTMVMVAAAGHPLARLRGPLTQLQPGKYTQLILTDHSRLSDGRSFGVISPNIWKLTDLGAKQAFLRAGLGWGGMPLPMVEKDLIAGTLARLEVEGAEPNGHTMPMSVVYPAASPPGPAGRWFIETIRECVKVNDGKNHIAGPKNGLKSNTAHSQRSR